jgi:hypothetical protein
MTRTTTHSDQRPRTPAQHSSSSFSSLDEERQASMADEGGVSAVLAEVDGEERPPDVAERPRRFVSWKLVLGLALVGIAAIFVARTYPPR